MDMSEVKAFNAELSGLYENKPPISKAKMSAITRGAIKAIKFYKHVVHSVEKFIQKCKPEYKVPGLYVIDSIVRQSRHQFGQDKDVFAPRFAKNMQQTFANLFRCPPEDKRNIIRVLNLWQKNNVFGPDVIQPLMDMADPNHPLHQEYKATNNNVTGSSLNVSGLSASDNKSSPAPQQHTPHVSTPQGEQFQDQPSSQPNVKFNRKLLNDFEYDSEDDQPQPEPEPPRHAATPQQNNTNNPADALGSILTNPEIMRQLQSLQAQMQMMTGMQIPNLMPMMSDIQLPPQPPPQESKDQDGANESDIEFVDAGPQVIEIPDANDSRSPSPKRRHRSRSRSPKRRRRSRSRSRSPRRRRDRERDREKEREKSQKEKEEREKQKEREKRGLPPIKKEHLSVCSTTLWVGHLSKLATPEELSDMFGAVGGVASIDVVAPRGCAFVVMERRRDAHRAKQKLDKYKLHTKEITVAWAPGKGVKGREWKDYWEAELGVSYLPWGALHARWTMGALSLDALEDGGAVDEETLPPWLPPRMIPKMMETMPLMPMPPAGMLPGMPGPLGSMPNMPPGLPNMPGGGLMPRMPPPAMTAGMPPGMAPGMPPGMRPPSIPSGVPGLQGDAALPPSGALLGFPPGMPPQTMQQPGMVGGFLSSVLGVGGVPLPLLPQQLITHHHTPVARTTEISQADDAMELDNEDTHESDQPETNSSNSGKGNPPPLLSDQLQALLSKPPPAFNALEPPPSFKSGQPPFNTSQPPPEKEDDKKDKDKDRRDRRDRDRDRDRGSDRGSDRGNDRGNERGIDRGNERGNERGIDRGNERGIDRGNERGIDRGRDRRDRDRGRDRDRERDDRRDRDRDRDRGRDRRDRDRDRDRERFSSRDNANREERSREREKSPRNNANQNQNQDQPQHNQSQSSNEKSLQDRLWEMANGKPREDKPQEYQDNMALEEARAERPPSLMPLPPRPLMETEAEKPSGIGNAGPGAGPAGGNNDSGWTQLPPPRQPPLGAPPFRAELRMRGPPRQQMRGPWMDGPGPGPFGPRFNGMPPFIRPPFDRPPFDGGPFDGPPRPLFNRMPFDNMRPPFDGPRPPFDGPRPPFDGPRPPFDGPRPPFDGPRPPFDGPRPPFDGSRPPFDGPRPPFDGPMPPFDGPMPPFDGPRPPFDGSRPPFDGPPQFDDPRPFDGPYEGDHPFDRPNFDGPPEFFDRNNRRFDDRDQFDRGWNGDRERDWDRRNEWDDRRRDRRSRDDGYRDRNDRRRNFDDRRPQREERNSSTREDRNRDDRGSSRDDRGSSRDDRRSASKDDKRSKDETQENKEQKEKSREERSSRRDKDRKSRWGAAEEPSQSEVEMVQQSEVEIVQQSEVDTIQQSEVDTIQQSEVSNVVANDGGLIHVEQNKEYNEPTERESVQPAQEAKLDNTVENKQINEQELYNPVSAFEDTSAEQNYNTQKTNQPSYNKAARKSYETTQNNDDGDKDFDNQESTFDHESNFDSQVKSFDQDFSFGNQDNNLSGNIFDNQESSFNNEKIESLDRVEPIDSSSIDFVGRESEPVFNEPIKETSDTAGSLYDANEVIDTSFSSAIEKVIPADTPQWEAKDSLDTFAQETKTDTQPEGQTTEKEGIA